MMFSIHLGNKYTLKTAPKEKNINIREELLKFHSEWYSSNIMALAVLGKGIHPNNLCFIYIYLPLQHFRKLR